MKRIGLISDTHGTFDDTLQHFLADVDEIWHAGDIGSLELSDRIAAFKPLRAVCGNTDGGVMRRVWPLVDFFRCEEATVLMTHIGGYPRHYDPRILQRLQSARPTLFIAGHSHILRIMYDPVYQLLHLNPGGAGNYGIHKVRTALRFVVDGYRLRRHPRTDGRRRQDEETRIGYRHGSDHRLAERQVGRAVGYPRR